MVFASALLAAGVNAYYLIKFPRGTKWWLRFVQALAIVAFGFIYLLMGIDYFDLPTYGPMLIRPGIATLLLLLAAEPLYDISRG
jgi:hypothetical protein